MRKRALSIPVFVALLVIATSAGRGFGQAHTSVDVAAWNVNGSSPIGAEKVDKLARAIVALDADLIALSELSPDTVIEDLGARLGAGYRYVLLDQTAPQNLAIVYKAGLDVSNARLVAGSDDDKRFLRKALTARVRAGAFDFVLVVVHLKAGHRGSDIETRGRQAAAVAKFLKNATSGAEKDVLVIGDYNMQPGESQANFAALNPGGFLRFLSNEELRGAISHIKSCSPRRGSLLDGFAISAVHTTEYVEGSLKVFSADRALGMKCAEYVREVSDQLPLVARFRATTDDD